MRYFLWAAVLAAVVGVVSCRRDLQITAELPLLLEEPENARQPIPPEGPVADNNRCFVCHINLAEEELAVRHANANVGCVMCHGESSPHSNDEANVTPPDIMYPKEKINPSCLKCHAGEKLSDAHKPLLAGIATDKKYCTDCHGEHRLARRRQRWDKESGKVLTHDDVDMTTGEGVAKR